MRKGVSLKRLIRGLLLINLVLAGSARGLEVTYDYEGNPFVEFTGTENIFSTEDRVTARFSVDCAVAHAAGDCRNLPYADYAQLGAVRLEPFGFAAGPARLPTADGGVDIARFLFSTDARARLLDWDMDLSFTDASGLINVDTDNGGEGFDSAAISGAFANVNAQPGTWEYDLPPTQVGFDLAVSKTVDNPVPTGPGQTVEFAIELWNSGDTPAEDVVVEDKLPTGLSIPEGMAAYASRGSYDPSSGRWEVGVVEPGAAPEVLTIPVVITADPQPVCVLNTAYSDMPGDTDPGNNQSTSILHRPDVDRCVDLSVKLFAWYLHSAECSAEGEIRYQLEISNAGPDRAKDVTVDISETLYQAPGFRIRFPTGCDGLRCSWEALAPGETVMVDVSSDYFQVQAPKEHAIEVLLGGDVPDYMPADNTLVYQLVIQPFPEAPCIPATGGGGFGSIDLGGGGGCFIATAAYGSASHHDVQVLRAFRDEVLLQTKWGRTLVDAYYRHSPACAAYIAEHDYVRMLARASLVPVVLAVAWSYQSFMDTIN